MSFILTRHWGRHIPIPAYCLTLFQMYRDADIYGKGKWEGDNCPWWHFPEQYADRDDAVRIAKKEKEKDPSWVYHVEFYDR